MWFILGTSSKKYQLPVNLNTDDNLGSMHDASEPLSSCIGIDMEDIHNVQAVEQHIIKEMPDTVDEIYEVNAICTVHIEWIPGHMNIDENARHL